MFTRAITKMPCKAMTQGLTSADLGLPDYEKALRQHADYVATLAKLGVAVTVLGADERFPDSVFVEDTAIVTAKGAILANPGAASRNGEKEGMADALADAFGSFARIEAPGTLDGGDVMMVEGHFYVGLSERTNRDGARQLIAFLESKGFSGSAVEIEGILHLKTGINYLARNVMVATAAMAALPLFAGFEKILVPDEEAYAANSLYINGTVIVPSGFPRTLAAIEAAGFPAVTTDTSEFRKLDGGLSCLSLRY